MATRGAKPDVIGPGSRPLGGSFGALGEQHVNVGCAEHFIPYRPQERVRNESMKEVAHAANEKAFPLGGRKECRLHGNTAEFPDALGMQRDIVFSILLSPRLWS